MDASDTIIYVSQKAQTVPGHGKATPVGYHAVTSGVLLACYSPVYRSPVSLVATARIHTLLTDMLNVVSCMPVPVS